MNSITQHMVQDSTIMSCHDTRINHANGHFMQLTNQI